MQLVCLKELRFLSIIPAEIATIRLIDLPRLALMQMYAMVRTFGETNMAKKTTATKKKTTKKIAAPKANGKAKVVKAKRVSALDAAHTVLVKAGSAMASKELIAAMAESGLWQSPGGKTPWATLYAAMSREIALKGKDARFRKVERGQFDAVGGGK